ncbi:Mut7-C RNAse domain-containing protein [Sandaracinus amylolyticus]|uniref:Mut7-C RNAse domain-containing protein n=1 Tax=Sandaracinus amylolyticus TaxID=927083 RepID=UPI001F1EDE75|nr:Mut7-C RNAse domain-containing protein [Sandaracinus amylolyticus]UJR83409.1 Hypothetical protein I5071_54770 [Sandaracinus amylolyticus]
MVRFLCDSMLGGLSRWLRSSGYDAEFAGPIDDGELVIRAEESGAILLTSDGPLMRRRPITSGTVRALLVPRAQPLFDQTVFVLRELALPVIDPRCMSCGGALVPVGAESLAREVPAMSLSAFDEFWRCDRCARAFWKGSHWEGIVARRVALAEALR